MGHQAIAGPVAAVLHFLLGVLNGLYFYGGHPALFMNLKQIVIVPSNTRYRLKRQSSGHRGQIMLNLRCVVPYFKIFVMVA